MTEIVTAISWYYNISLQVPSEIKIKNTVLKNFLFYESTWRTQNFYNPYEKRPMSLLPLVVKELLYIIIVLKEKVLCFFYSLHSPLSVLLFLRQIHRYSDFPEPSLSQKINKVCSKMTVITQKLKVSVDLDYDYSTHLFVKETRSWTSRQFSPSWIKWKILRKVHPIKYQTIQILKKC